MSEHCHPARVPVLLLTGFLGSGKTTLLNRLIRARPDSRGKLAIVVNELGQVGIDGDLLPAAMTRQIELPGGCICCVLNEDLDRTLVELLDSTPDIEIVVIETTGVAEPLPIAWTLDREPLSERVRLAAVITVVDALELERSRPLSVAVDAQVEYADILVLSKLDLLDTGQVPAPLVAILDHLNPTALRLTGSSDHIVDLLWKTVLDPALPEVARASGRAAPRDGMPAHQEPPGEHAAHHEAGQGAEHLAHHHPLPHGFSSIALAIPQEIIDFEELTSQLEELPSNYVRIKGIARVIDGSTGSDEPRWIAFHRVGTRVSCEPLAEPAAARMVALGRDMDADRLAACLAASVALSE